MSLAGKVAIVTGGGTGIGLGISRILANHGARIAIVQIDTSSCPFTAAEIGSGVVAMYQADVADRTQVDGAVETVIRHFGRIDILVNNAAVTGAHAVSSFLDCSGPMLDRIVDVNFKGVFHCSQSVARHMVANSVHGSIVHISSVGAFAAQEHASVYCATKAALVSLAQSMALELAPYGIRTNCVAPGDILTETNARIVEDLKHGGATGRYLRATPAGRRGSPDDIGHAVAYLCSDEAAFVTGTTLQVDGGFLAY
jgi:NAD(P)-dependent dehydrogenase (short-subunit alcohol dehydrogenase family)